ncbi:glycosyl transferase family 2 [Chitinophaga sp. SYP-B3965]|uniref:glycosyl hydrolase n=1 Tax=Chitinophaga sp. SYP-B3965 TaxID=2663120 RepID=UPI0012997139|nr:glycosyl hydrolase [Chitinophaga sp. SYP-B3965]MRG48031.1 glycosyl transferase family 2 [Chitinophaga sp. SYP-B3965]
MDRRKFIATVGLGVGAGLLSTGNAFAIMPGDDIRQLFLNPPDSARPGCYWWWFNGLVNKEGLTRDLEEFRDKGIGNVLLVNSAGGLGGVQMPFGAKFLSDEWKELFKHAIKEAKRLNIDVGVNLCSGWAMGGPWITPEVAGRWVLQSEITIVGPQKFSGVLPLPGNRSGYDYVFNPPGFKDYIDLPLEKLDYRDTAVVAFPGGTKLDGERAKLIPAKTNRKDASNFIRQKDLMAPVLEPWSSAANDKPVPVAQVIDLTPKMRADGHLEWEVPAGSWTIVRTGHRMTGSRLMIAQPEADGLSVGWLSSEGVDIQFEHLGKVLLELAGPLKDNTLKYFCDDSFEDGFPNWTAKILQKFQEYRGYDASPYLPVLAGYIITSAEVSDRFLHDYRKTVADCMADGHYKRFAELCHEHGLKVQNESAGPSRSGTMCMDGLKNLGRSDQPMGEFWLGLRHDEVGGLDDNLGYGVSRLENGQNKVTKMAASASHIYGKKTASAEAFTTMRHWNDYPGNLKQAADRAYCEGINRLVIHTSTSQRPEDGKPGYEYGAGTHFNPNVTWWNKSGGFLAYMGRCQHLLQEGKFVADVLYYNGDWAPNIVEPKHIDPSLGFGYDYDVCNAEVLLTRLSVKAGRLVLPDGMSYRLLVLPDTARMPVEVVTKIKQLVSEGATVVGPRPSMDPGLKNYPVCDADVLKVSGEVWGNCDGVNVTFHKYGKGRVFWNKSLRDILQDDGVTSDFSHDSPYAFIDFIHRSTDDGEIYFLANRNNRVEKLNCQFRATGKPEIWDPVAADIRGAAFSIAGGRVSVPMEFQAFQSFFIVFPKRGTTLKGLPFPAFAPVSDIKGAWTVRFDTAWGGPASVQFPSLQDWTKRPEEGIKFYSGTATYVKEINVETTGRLFLDLGVVKNIAEVKLNGKSLGIVWTAPWRVEITSAVKTGTNLLEIEVVNLWPNRLIGDAALPPEKRLTNTNIPFKSDAPLLSSGLLGPVTINKIV